MALRIRYRSSDDEVTERVISDEVAEAPNAVTAYCHLRGESRTFALSRIEEAVDTSTGEVVPDIWLHFGLPSLKRPAPTMPMFSCAPVSLTEEQSKAQRSKDKRELFQRFKIEVISRTRRAQLEALFGSRCFKCGRSRRLVLDHHIPQFLGGRLVPGNVTLLCHWCNTKKLDMHPRDFYSMEELRHLQGILEQQLPLFDFAFNWTRWGVHPKEYLLSLGVSEADAERAIQESANSRENGISVTLTVAGTNSVSTASQPSESLAQRPSGEKGRR
ncbi:MAG: HNH endonuclease [Steroidobacteraceae bacterium]